MAIYLKNLIPVSIYQRINPALEFHARRLAAEGERDFTTGFCGSNSWFAAQAALHRGHSEVHVVAGFRVRSGAQWDALSAHAWIRIGDEHLEASPENNPDSWQNQYLVLWSLKPDEKLRRRIFAQHEDLITELLNWGTGLR